MAVSVTSVVATGRSLTGVTVMATVSVSVFAPPVPDFRLGCLKAQKQTFQLGPVMRPWILLVTEGRVTLRQGADVLELAKGQSAVILPDGPDSLNLHPSDVTATVQGVAYRAWSDL